MTVSPVKWCALPGWACIAAALYVLVGTVELRAAEPRVDVPAPDWPFSEGRAAADDVFGAVKPVPQRGPIRILPPNLSDDIELDVPGAGNTDLDVTLFPSGPSAIGRDVLPVKDIGARPGEAGSGVAMGSLGQLDEASAGLLDDATGGLSTGMWSGTGRQLVERTLGQVPGPASSAFMSDLSRRLLLTAARAPQGSNSGVSLLALRLRQLNAAGRSGDIVQLMARVGGARPSPLAASEFAKAALGAGESALACNMLATLPVGGDPSHDMLAAFATKLSIYCQILGGQAGAATLTADLAREQGLDDPYFLSLAAKASEGLVLDAPVPVALDALNFRMLQLAKSDFPGEIVPNLAPGLLASVADDGAFDPEIRVAAAERAAALGLISGDEMAAAYLSVPYTREDVDGVRIGREPASPFRRRAFFHQAVLDERVPAGRADLLAALFLREVGGPAYRATLVAHKGALATVPPSIVLSAFAPLAVRAFVELGDRVRAGMWLSTLNDQGARARQHRELRALVRLIDPSFFVAPPAIQYSSSADASPSQGSLPIPAIVQDALDDLAIGGRARDFAALEIVLLEGLGVQMPQAVWDALLAVGDLPGGAVPPIAVMRQLKRASEGGRVGETVLLTLAALNQAGPAGTHPQSLGAIVAALKRVGLDRDARRLSVEALMARMNTEG